MNEIIPLGILGGAVLSAALIGSALLGWLADLKRMGSATSARETTQREASRARAARARMSGSAPGQRMSGTRTQRPAGSREARSPRPSAKEQEDRIREAYFAKERKAREERERRRRAQSRENRARRARQSASGSAPPPAPTGSEESRHRATLELAGPVTPDSLRAAYRRLIAAYHPDRVATLGVKLRKLAEEETKRINEAYSYFRRGLK